MVCLCVRVAVAASCSLWFRRAIWWECDDTIYAAMRTRYFQNPNYMYVSCTVRTQHSQTHTTDRNQRQSSWPEPSSAGSHRINRSVLYKPTIQKKNPLIHELTFRYGFWRFFQIFRHPDNTVAGTRKVRSEPDPLFSNTWAQIKLTLDKLSLSQKCGSTGADWTWFRPAWRTSKIIPFIHSFRIGCARVPWLDCDDCILNIVLQKKKNRYNFICAHSVCDASGLDWKICLQTVGSSAATDQKICASHSVSIFLLFARMRNWRKPFSSRFEFVFFNFLVEFIDRIYLIMLIWNARMRAHRLRASIV